VKTHTRAAIAFIVANVVTETRVESIHDCSTEKDISFEGMISPTKIFLRDPQRGATLSGHSKNGIVTLYDSGDLSESVLTIKGSKFSGLNLNSSTTFSGTIEDSRVHLYDSDDKKEFDFTFEWSASLAF
jgi:hypothetical protein